MGPTLLSTMRSMHRSMVCIYLHLCLQERWIHPRGGWHQKPRPWHQTKHMALLLPVLGHTPKSWGMEGEACLSWEDQQVCVCVCGNLKTAGVPQSEPSFPLTLPLLHALTQAVVTESPFWVWWWHPRELCHRHMPISCLCRTTSTHRSRPLCQRHGHRDGIPFSALFLLCLCSGGPTWSNMLYRVLPTNQVLVQSLPSWNYHNQWRNTNSCQLQN